MFRSKKEDKSNMALDFSSYEKDCRSMGGLFQQLSHEMKHSSSVWQDFISKSNKFHTALGTMTVAMTSFIDSFQRIADMANNSKGAVRDIGGSLTKLCLRQRSVEAKLKEYVTIIGGTFSPIPGLLDDWKKTVIQMDHAHAKEYKKLNNEIQKNLSEANKLKKQVEKGGRAEKLQPSLDSKIKAMEWKYCDLATNECVSLKKLTLHERQRFSFFVKCLSPLLEKQGEIFAEATSLEEIKKILLDQTRDPDNVIKCCEDFVDEFRASTSDQQQTFVTPPGTPRCLTRHSSSLSIRSSNSALNQKRPHSLFNKQEQGDGQSVTSNSVSTTGPLETDSMLSQDTIVRDLTIKINPPTVENNNDESRNADNPALSNPSNSLTTFGSERRIITNSYDSLARKKQPKPPNSSEEDAELWLSHRNDPNRFFNQGMAIRSSVANKTNQGVQPLDSPVRPGRKNDKRATIGYSDSRQNDLQNPQYGFSNYATLGRSSFKAGSIKANFYGGNYSTGKIGHATPTSPPPPPPPLPSTNHNTQSPSSPNEQFEALLRSGSKKSSAPPPPSQTTSSLPPPITTESQGSRNSSFAYSPQFSVVSSQNVPQTNQNIQNASKTRLNHPPNITIPYYSSQTSTGEKSATPLSGKAVSPLTFEPGVVDRRSDSPTLTEIPIRILRKYPEGLITPPPSKNVNLEIMAPPKPPPPIRNSSMVADQSASHPEEKRQLGRTPSFKQQSAPKDCPPLPKATPLTISDQNSNSNNNNNNNGNNNSLDIRNNNNNNYSSVQTTNIA